MKNVPAKFDALLEPLLTEATDEHADEILLQLISVHAEPVIKGVIRYKLHLSPSQASQRADAEDIYQEVVVQLLGQLQRFRKLPDDHPITDVRGMAAIIAHRTCSGWLRRQFPERHATTAAVSRLAIGVLVHPDHDSGSLSVLNCDHCVHPCSDTT